MKENIQAPFDRLTNEMFFQLTLYIEQDKMFRNGSALEFAINSTTAKDRALVWDSSLFTTGDIIQIFDIDNQEGLIGELKQIVHVDSENNTLIFDTDCEYEYTATSYTDLNNPDSFVGLFDDKEIILNEKPYYESDTQKLNDLLSYAFVDFQFPTLGAGVLPKPIWTSSPTKLELDAFSSKWWHNSNIGARNHIHLLGAHENPIYSDYGVTCNDKAMSFIYVEEIERDSDHEIIDTTIHELIHNFMWSISHCGNWADAIYPPWGADDHCIMSPYYNINDDTWGLCLAHLLTANDDGDEPLIDESIRRQIDDIRRIDP